MTRETKALLTFLLLLAVAVCAWSTWNYWVLRMIANPLQLRVVKVEQQGGWKVVHLEVTNASWFDIEFRGVAAACQQKPDGSLFHSLVEEDFPNSAGGLCRLSAGETVTGTFRKWDPVACSYHYEWEPQPVNTARSAGPGPKGKLPEGLAKFIQMSTPIYEQPGVTEEVLIPGGPPVPATTDPEPQAR
ncbi:hypothetical protein [Roseimicrobium sp. ORNL1]|uniref:hypothetical protein n=1 Tax=Roseimicrobium sp. ORNL1 TaxID=2711231 RepID=UPI0013E14FEA|nr:hypothetical protein [Roseimicrobium sp. ORNL1]QIF03588.1 hypothetical protein G5S37_19355 [Roseimicrobium sp. ORNL1]